MFSVKKYKFSFDLGGFNESFATSVEVFDVSRGIWRDFTIGIQVGNRTKCQVHAISDDSLAIIGGKDEVKLLLLILAIVRRFC